MNISKAGIDFIKKNEGCSLVAYPDGKGINEGFSIGYGHYLSAEEAKRFTNSNGGISITQIVADALLMSDISERVSSLNGALKVEVSQTLFDSLIDYGFSMSGRTLAGSHLVKLINNGASVDELKKHWQYSYVKYGSDRLYKPLVDRRKREVDLAFSDFQAKLVSFGFDYTPAHVFFALALLFVVILLALIYFFSK